VPRGPRCRAAVEGTATSSTGGPDAPPEEARITRSRGRRRGGCRRHRAEVEGSQPGVWLIGRVTTHNREAGVQAAVRGNLALSEVAAPTQALSQTPGTRHPSATREARRIVRSRGRARSALPMQGESPSSAAVVWLRKVDRCAGYPASPLGLSAFGLAQRRAPPTGRAFPSAAAARYAARFTPLAGAACACADARAIDVGLRPRKGATRPASANSIGGTSGRAQVGGGEVGRRGVGSGREPLRRAQSPV
jgi:hypothetical protein